MPKRTQLITPKQAAQIAQEQGINISVMTVYKWIKDYDLGYQIGGSGKWFIYVDKYLKFLAGEGVGSAKRKSKN